MLNAAKMAWYISKYFGIFSLLKIAMYRTSNNNSLVELSYNGKNIYVRANDSDLFSFIQIFHSSEYKIDTAHQSALSKFSERLGEEETPLIVDAGANVGFASLYLASEFRGFNLFSIEPDPESFKIMEQNVKSIDNITLFHGALWKDTEGVSFTRGGSGAWAGAVSAGSGMASTSLEKILQEMPNHRIVILKVDIEGSERFIFENHDLIRRIPCIMVEPHDFLTPGWGSLTGLLTALAGISIDVIINGENIFIFNNEILEYT